MNRNLGIIKAQVIIRHAFVQNYVHLLFYINNILFKNKKVIDSLEKLLFCRRDLIIPRVRNLTH